MWMWTSEQDQIFKEYSIDTWHKILHDMEAYFATCQRWKIKIDEQKKDEHNLFTTKNYVLIQTLHVHNQELCVHPNYTCSQSRGMC